MSGKVRTQLNVFTFMHQSYMLKVKLRFRKCFDLLRIKLTDKLSALYYDTT